MPKNELRTKASDPTSAVFGVDPDGKAVVLDISSGPHWLCCGQTGSGKSVYVNNILVSMICHSLPSELKIAWIDPKKVEATAYVDLPYCLVNPVTDMNDAYGLIAYVTWLMDERYSVLESLKLKKIDEYNEWVDENPEEAEQRGLEKWPYIVIVIDEYADLVMVAPEVEKNIARLGQKARASGTHLIIATQRPSADIVTGIIKANVPSRIGLKTTDSNNSLIVLDETGCETLRGYGDSLVKTVNGDMLRAQGPFISNGEIDVIFKQLRDLYGVCEEVDYKTVCVEQGLCEWAENYDDDVPSSQRHVVKPKRRSGLGF